MRKKHATRGLASVCCLLLLYASPATGAPSDFIAGTYTDASGGVLLYHLFVPNDYDPDRQYPLMLYLHGAGEGTESVTAVTAVTRMSQWAKTEQYASFVLVPRSPGGWASSFDSAPTVGLRRTLELLEKLPEEYSIDARRLYITGLSMGGYGTWEAIARHPDKFAAAVPVSGGGQTRSAARIKDVPIWAWHGSADTVVPPQQSRAMIDAVRAAGGNPRYTELLGFAHDGAMWSRSYGDEELYDWMFSQSLVPEPGLLSALVPVGLSLLLRRRRQCAAPRSHALEAHGGEGHPRGELLEPRHLMAVTPVIVFNFDEGLGNPATTTVVNAGSSGAIHNGTLATTPGRNPITGQAVPLMPRFGGVADDGTRSPAGGSYLTFDGDGVFHTGGGGRVEVGSIANRASWLHPILGNSSSIAYWVKTLYMTARHEIWASPAVTGNEHSGFSNDVFFGSVSQERADTYGRLRAAGGNGEPTEARSRTNDGTWHHIVHTRDAATGVVRTYVDGLLDASGTSDPGVKTGVFRSIGALTVSNNPDEFTIAGYTHFNGSLDQVEIYDRVLTPAEVLQAYGGPVRVKQVLVGGPGINPAAPSRGHFLFQRLAGVERTFGYRVPDGSAQLAPVSWSGGVSRIAVRFDRNAQGQLDSSDLVVRGTSRTYSFSGFRYDPDTHTAIWTLAGSPVTLDKLRITLDDAAISGLDGEWSGPSAGNPAGDTYPSGDGNVDGDFSFRINVLTGDTTRDGVVDAADQADVERRMGRRAGDGFVGAYPYSVFADMTADGLIDASDLQGVTQNLNRRLDDLPDPVAALGVSNSLMTVPQLSPDLVVSIVDRPPDEPERLRREDRVRPIYQLTRRRSLLRSRFRG